jgi:hypothetical protein
VPPWTSLIDNETSCDNGSGGEWVVSIDTEEEVIVAVNDVDDNFDTKWLHVAIELIAILPLKWTVANRVDVLERMIRVVAGVGQEFGIR